MGMSGGDSSGGATPNINVTPLIDVLLVLLIIFMVITPMKPSRFEAKVPAEPKPEDQTIAKPNPLTLVVAINNADKKITLNNDPIGDVTNTAELTSRLTTIFKDREAQEPSEKEQTKWKKLFSLNRRGRSNMEKSSE